MARELRWWVGAALLACVALTLAYVPPRGGVTPAATAMFMDALDKMSPARRRALQLDRQRYVAEMRLRVAEVRQALEPELARRRVAEKSGPTLLLREDGQIPESARRRLAAALDSTWHELGLGVSKVSVGVVVEWAGTPVKRDNLSRLSGNAYLLPDATDPATCLVLKHLDDQSAARLLLVADGPRAQIELQGWLRHGLGPCAFYAAYGVPGRPVRRWLSSRGYDLALVPDWNGTSRAEFGRWLRDPSTQQWRWAFLYGGFPARLSATALACAGGRPAACRDAVLAGADDRPPDSESRFVVIENAWWQRATLLNGTRYLADVAHDVGPERFLRFWNTEDPVDTALATALKMPTGEWTERWQRHFVPRLPLGAAAPLSACALGLLLAGVAVSGAGMVARRRQVR